MPPSFTITTPAPVIPANAAGHAEVNFTVANTSGVPSRAMAKVIPSGAGTRAEWFSIAGENERDFPVSGNQQFTVIAKVPADVKEGSYPFRFDVISARKASEERVEGPVVTLAVPARVVEEKKKSYWWIIIAVIALLAVIGVVAYLATRPDEPATDTSTTATTDMTGTTATTDTTPTISATILDISVPVPSVINAPIAVAEADIRRAGLNPRRNLVTDDLIPVGNVKDQRPAGNTRAFPGTEVVLDVVSGPELIDVPDLTGVEFDKVRSIVEGLGLNATVEAQPTFPPRRGRVVAQNPPAGSKVRRGQTVHVVIDGFP